jgi:hypothetical protein
VTRPALVLVAVLTITAVTALDAQRIGATSSGTPRLSPPSAYRATGDDLPRSPLRWVAGDVRRAPVPTDTLTDYDTSLPRALLGIGGAVAGLYVGAGASGLGSPIEDAAAGTIVGALLGASLAAGAPRIGSSCSAPARVRRGLFGSAIGGAAGIVAGIWTGSGAGVLMLMTAGAGTGAGVAASGCHRR